MTSWEVVRLVAAREIRERVRSKGFRISAAVTLLIVVAIAVLPGMLAGDGTTTYHVGVFGNGSDRLGVRLAAASLGPERVKVEVRRVDGAREARRLVGSGDLDAAVGEGRVVVDQELGNRLGVLLAEANRQLVTEAALAEAGVTGEAAARVLDPPALSVTAVHPPSPGKSEREGLVFVGTILLYGQLLGFGFWVANGVVEEKASRVVELLLAKASSARLLAGKIVGIGVVGLVQLVGLVVVGLVAASASGSVDLPPETASVAVQVVAWFVLGFAFYSCLFAVGGAMASRVEDLQSTTTPLSFVAMGSFFAAIFAGNDPGGPVARVATFLPPSAPLVLPIRVAAGEVGPWAVAASVAIVSVSIVAVVGVAARVYAGGALHFRGQLTLRQALRAGAGPEQDAAMPTG